MEYLSLLLIAFALSLDAFSVSITCGIKLQSFKLKKYLKIAFTFGYFQALMPLGGWLLGLAFRNYISSYSSWVSFAVFLFLGLKTFYDARKDKDKICLEACNCDKKLCLSSLAFATSIDAFIVGVVLALYEIPFYISLPLIGVTTFFMSLLGSYIGHKANLKFKKKALILAGLILLLLAIKSLL